jgi:hypothetical protein
VGHCITAIILLGPYDRDAAAQFDLAGIDLGQDLTLFHITHYFTAVWQKKLGIEGDLPGAFPRELLFPTERVSAVLMRRITGREPVFALITTDYFGGIGDQWAQLYRGEEAADPPITAISPALRWLGVQADEGRDEFDTVGLAGIRQAPDSLDRYVELAEELGV